jgi:tryptophanyl-tRNA synthetase
MQKPVVLTGLRANSEFHIGNYLGGILPVIAMQQRHAGEFQVNMFIPDLHSFTTPIDHSRLYDQTIENLKVFVAAGLDINNVDTYIYRQSFVPAHSELTWILDCFTGFGQASRMTEFKDKSSSLSQESISVGLFNYPILMAADILLYDAKYVPVGDDQKQHLELTRDLAVRLNNKFDSKLFTVPEAWNKQLAFMNLEAGARIRSLRSPEKKMSKSVDDPSGTIMLSDDPNEASNKIMRAETDSIGSIHYDFDTQPGITNLLQILASLTGQPQHVVNEQWEGNARYGDLKSAVAAEVVRFLINFQEKLKQVDEKELLDILHKDEATMNDIANAKLLQVQIAVGLRSS